MTTWRKFLSNLPRRLCYWTIASCLSWVLALIVSRIAALIIVGKQHHATEVKYGLGSSFIFAISKLTVEKTLGDSMSVLVPQTSILNRLECNLTLIRVSTPILLSAFNGTLLSNVLVEGRFKGANTNQRRINTAVVIS